MAFRWRNWPEEGDKVSCCSWVTLLKFSFSLSEWCISIEDDRRFDRCNMLWTVVSDNSFVLSFPSRVVHLRILICMLFALYLVWWSLPSHFPSTSLYRPFACVSLTRIGRQASVQEPLPEPLPTLFPPQDGKYFLYSFLIIVLKKGREQKRKKFLRKAHNTVAHQRQRRTELKP